MDKSLTENTQGAAAPEEIVVTTVEERRAQWEAEKLTRRQSLARFGFLAGAACVAALTADELTRKVGEELSKRAGDNQVAQKVASEFKNAGVAFAGACQTPIWPLDEEIYTEIVNTDFCSDYYVYRYCSYHFKCTPVNTKTSRCEDCCRKVYWPGSGCAGHYSSYRISECQRMCRELQGAIT